MGAQICFGFLVFSAYSNIAENCDFFLWKIDKNKFL